MTKDVKLLLTFNSLRKISDLFVGTFLVSFIMHSSINEIISVSIYQFFNYLALIFGFFVFASWIKRKNKVNVFRLSQIPKIVMLVMIVFMNGDINEYIIPLGLLVGLNSAMYWLPMHTMVCEKVGRENMTKFTGYKNAISGLTKIIAPVLLGFFISVGSYEQMAKVVLIFAVIEFILSFFLSSSKHRSKNKLDLKGFFNCMMRFPIIRKLFSIEIMRGFSTSGALGTVITMYTVYMFKTDMNLGIFTTIFSCFSIVTSYLFGRFCKKKMFSKILFSAALASLLSLVLFICNTVEWTFLIYNFVYVTAISLMEQITEINMYNLSNSKCVTKDHKTEYFVFRESALGIGRLTAFLILIYVGVFGGYEYLRYYLAVLTIAILLVGFWSIRINKFIKG